MKINMPENVTKIISELNCNGFKAYAVGGCVRDSILGTTPNDWDITTNASPDEIESVFKNFKTIETGKKHGTITLIIDKVPYEITTMRIDGDYTDNRHPDKVEFTRNIKDDLMRRDFTINAMAYNDEDGIVDEFSSVTDINNKIIRCVGNPDKRFNEDALRIMRCLRFSATLGFKIEEKTAKSALKNRELLKNVANERIRDELLKLLCGKDVEKILTDYKDIIFLIIPELALLYEFQQNTPYHIYDIWKHTVKAVAISKNDANIRLAVLLHDIGKPYRYYTDSKNIAHFKTHPFVSAEISKDILLRLRLPKKDCNNLYELIRLHDTRPTSEVELKKLISKYSPNFVKTLFEIMKADTLAHSREVIDERYPIVEQLYNKIDDMPYITLKNLAVNGNDLKKAGYKGTEIKTILEKLLNLVLENKVKNKSDELLNLI